MRPALVEHVAHILCIDDEQMIRQTIGDYLVDEGYQVSLAADGREGLEKYSHDKPDLVIVDLRMPHVDGFEVIREITSSDAETPIIVVSGMGDIGDALEAIRLGAWDYLTKPIGDMGILQMALSNGLEKSRLLKENRRYRSRLENLIKQRTDELTKSEERFRRLAENAHDIIIRISLPDLVFQYVNPAIEDITGYGKDEFLNDFNLIYRIVPEKYRETLRHFFVNAAAGKVSDSLEYLIQSRDGSEKWILQRNVLVYEEGAPAALEIIAGDITARRHSEKEKEVLIHDLEMKNAELERFTYTASHDLRSPLVTIKGFIGMLRDDISSGDMENVEEDLDRIDGAAEKMHNFLSDLLELSRVGRVINESRRADLREVIESVREILFAAMKEKQAVLNVPDKLPFIYGDIPRIEEVFQNLFENSLKFSPENVTPEITIEAQSLDDCVEIIVRDNGKGITPEYHERVFGLFNKLDKQSDGTGVGLALIKRIIEVHGGDIRLESVSGEGAAFVFTLPLPPAEER